MENELSELLARAAKRLQVQSDRALCRALGLHIARLPQYRRGTAFPTDERMVRICLASGVAPETGLLMLNMWRSRGTVRTAYRRIHKLWAETHPSKPEEQKAA